MKYSYGLDFFAMSVDFFDDEKLALIESEFGIKGSYVATRLLCRIYKYDGYFLQWGWDQCSMFTKQLGGGFVPGIVDEIVRGLIRRDFFDKAVFDSFHVLTSRGIQYRWLEASKRRSRVAMHKEYCLVDTTPYPNVIILDPNFAPLSFTANPEGVDEAKQTLNPEKVKKAEDESQKDDTRERYQILEKFFFEKNFLAPEKEYKNIINWNNLNNRSWAKMSHEQKMSAADMWVQKDSEGRPINKRRFTEDFLSVWIEVAKSIKKNAPDLYPNCLSDQISFTTGLVQDMYGPNRQDYSALRCSEDLIQYIGRDHWRDTYMDIFQPLMQNGVHLRFCKPKT